MLSFIHDNWHGWQSHSQFLLSDELSKRLRYFDDADQAVGWLYLEGYRDAARALNNAIRKAA
jgi:hypothetical protein